MSRVLLSCLCFGMVANFACTLPKSTGDQSLLAGPVDGSWETEPKRRKRAPYKSRKLINKRQSLEELVRGFSTSQECYNQAKLNSASNLKASWALVMACIEYRSYDQLEEILDEPWLRIHQSNWANSAKLVARLSAMRGGNVEFDVGVCNRLGFDLRNLGDLLRDVEGEKNTLTLFRGKLRHFAKRSGKLHLFLSNNDGDIYGVYASQALQLKSGTEYVLLGMFRGVRDVSDSKHFSDEAAVIDLKAVYPIASPGAH